MKGVKVSSIIGGTSVSRSLQDAQNSHVLVGTPGRVLDVFKRGALSTSQFRVVVLDEAEDIVANAKDDLLEIFTNLRTSNINVVVSVTMLHLQTSEFLERNILGKNSVWMLVSEPKDLFPPGVKNYRLSFAREESKLEAVCNHIQLKGSCIIFCNSRQKVDSITSKLQEKQLPASANVCFTELSLMLTIPAF
jgi:superfamily II DNA/RNA helicase